MRALRIIKFVFSALAHFFVFPPFIRSETQLDAHQAGRHTNGFIGKAATLLPCSLPSYFMTSDKRDRASSGVK